MYKPKFMDSHPGHLRKAVSQPRDMSKWSVLASFSRHSTNSFLNYAIPDDGAIPSLTDVKALIAMKALKPASGVHCNFAPAVEEVLTEPVHR